MTHAPILALVAAIASLAAAPMASAQAVRNCDGNIPVDWLAEPWEDNTATYAKGAIRVAKLDSIEPAAAAVHLLVIAPPLDELGLPQCRVVSQTKDGSGFFTFDFAGRSADYDAATGLMLTFPAMVYVPEMGEGKPAQLNVTINQQTGAIAATMRE